MFPFHDVINMIMTQKLSDVSPSLIISSYQCVCVFQGKEGGREGRDGVRRRVPVVTAPSRPGVPLTAEAEQPDAPDTGRQQRLLCGTAARG